MIQRIFRRVRRAEQSPPAPLHAKEGLVRLGTTSKLLRGDYGENEDNYRRYQP